MNTIGKYKGMTPEELLSALSSRGEDEQQMVAHVRSVLADLVNDREEEVKKLEAEYVAMYQEEKAPKSGYRKGNFPLKTPPADPESYLKKMAKQRKIDALGTLVRDLRLCIELLGKGVQDSLLQMAPFNLSPELKNPEEILAAIEKIRSDLAASNSPDVMTKSDVDSFLLASKRMIDSYQVAITQEPGRMELIYNAAMRLHKGQASKLRGSITGRISHIEEWDSFSEELASHLQSLEDRVSLLSSGDNALDPMRINWQGGNADLKILMDFLINNGYIKTSKVNQFIARHFLIDGERKSAVQVSKFISHDVGSFKVRNDGSLLIPGKYS